ncbi:Glyoxalase/Bleomycin resistance protein/Dihydroxybiphenyl dioxygenase [Lyophyllum atratum]|nr:Glyoxalase/Bleomycin resistance protein/Dihydroxybiphenyl dioxygenase [Lyophyllum atratum]
MLFHPFSAILLLLPALNLLVGACSPNILKRAADAANGNSPTQAAGPVFGADIPQPPETVGYALNHLAIQVADLNRSIEFYTSVMGLKHIFTLETAPGHSISILQYPHGGRNGTGDQTVLEMAREVHNSEGVLELVWSQMATDQSPNLKDLARSPSFNPAKSFGFSHLGFVVPDIAATTAHLQAKGVRILKRAGALEAGNGLPTYFGFTKPNAKLPLVFQQLTVSFMFAQDPDGYLMEFMEQD